MAQSRNKGLASQWKISKLFTLRNKVAPEIALVNDPSNSNLTVETGETRAEFVLRPDTVQEKVAVSNTAAVSNAQPARTSNPVEKTAATIESAGKSAAATPTGFELKPDPAPSFKLNESTKLVDPSCTIRQYSLHQHGQLRHPPTHNLQFPQHKLCHQRHLHTLQCQPCPIYLPHP